MGFMDEYNALKKKRKEEETTNPEASFMDRYNELKQQQAEPINLDDIYYDDNVRPEDMTIEQLRSMYHHIAPKKLKYDLYNFAQLPLLLNKDIPNISEYERKVYQLARENGIGEPEDEPVKKRTWFDAGPFSDGYDFGDISKSILGTIGDIKDDAVEGVVGMVEPALDTILYAGGNAFDKAGSFMFGKENWNTMWRMNRWRNGNYIASGNGDSPLQEIISEKIAEDMINEEAVTDVLAFDASKLFMDPEDYSLLGDKSDSLVQSGGQLAATIGLNAVGVPWFATTGVTSFGKELDNAVNQGASLGEAGTSAAITAATEIITEKIFNGISFGGKTLESVTLKPLIDKISNKTVRTLVKFGLDIGGEGVEEILAGYGSAIGQKLTYADEKELNELFSKEDRWESFIGGMVLSMGGNGVTLHNSIKNGVDYVSGMTANEEAVVNKETEKRIAELEKDGNKLKPSEKSKIKERVLNDLKKGFVSTDTIEEVLGGETYNTYKDTVDSEDAQIKQLEDQIKELGDAPNTVANSKKFDSLQQQLDELKNNSKRDQLKLQLSDEVFGLVKDSRLSESYNENGRRSQVFEADLTKYDEKQRETVQRAIDSGILNNTNRTHDFVDMVAKVSADKGVLFDFTNNDKLKGSVFAVEGKTVNGYFDKESGTVGVNIDSAKALNTVVGHEITHVLEGTELYDAMKQTLFEYAKSKGEYQSRYDAFVELYKDVKDADIEAELAADLVGDYLFTDADFINHLSTKNRNVFQKIYDELLYLYKIANAGSKEAMQLEKVKKAFEKAYREGGKAQKNTANDGGAKYSIETLPDGKKYVRADRQVIYGNDPDSWSEQVEDYINGKIRKGENISLVAEDGEILTLTANTAGKIASNKTSHGTTMSDEKFYVKANAGVHIDELAQVSVNDNPNKKPKADQDARHGAFAEGGWTYRTAFFHDFDGKYYRLKISAAMGKDGTVVYNIGDIEERSFPKVTGSSAKGGALNGKASSFANVAQNGENVKYSLSDTDGKQLSQEQQEYFKDSKLRDENGNLKVMYHGSQNAGFHVFDARMSDDDTSFFFVDRNDVASSYSGTSETYEAKTIRSSEDMNNFLAEIGYDQYEAVEKNGKFELLENGDHVAWSDTAHGIYEEFCWYEGVGEGDANYKVYLNLTNPLEVDAKGKNWNNVSREFSQEIADRYHSLTAEEKAALQDLTEWGEYGIFKDEMLEARASGNSILASAYEKLGGANANLYDAFSIASDNFSEDAISQFAAKQMNTRDYAQRAKEQGYDGVIFKNIVDIGQYGGTHTPATVAIAFDSNQIKSTANAKPTGDADIRYSLSDSDGRELSPAVQNRFADSKVVDADGRLMSVFHGTATGEFSIFDKSKGSVEGDFGSGFYFTDNEADVSEHYEGGGPDFDNKVARLAEQIEAEEDIDYDEAEQRARDELFQGSHKFEVYLNIKNPAIVGETMLLDGESYMEQYNEEDYDDYDDYLGDVEQLVADDIDNIVLEVERNCDVDDTDGISGILREAYFEGGIGIEELKKKINDLYLEDSNGNLVGNEVTRQIIESLGYDGIIDPTVSTKWNMNIEPGTKHYIVFKPNQIKSVTNQNPTDNPDIHRSLSTKGEKHPIYGNYNVSGKDITLEAGPVSEDVTPVQKTVSEMETVAPVTEETELFPDTPVAQSAVVKLDQLNQQKEALEGRMLEAVGAEDYDAFYQLNNEYEALMQEIEALDQEVAAEDADRINSLTEEDIPPETEANTPPEMDAPYYGDNQTNQVDDPFEDRDWHEVGNRKVKAYMYENPEVKPFFQEEARNLLGELNSTTRGERWYNDQLYYESGGEAGFGGVSRHTSASMEELLDSWGMSYADIEKGLNAIIEDHGAENIAAAKKLEFMLNDRLLNGYKDFYSNGRIPPNQDYINLLNEKQITEYSKESFDALMANADQYAPSVEDDIAPIPGQSNSTETALGNRVLNRQQTYITTEDKLKTRHPQQGVDAAALAPFSENTSGQQTMFEGAEKANETIRQNKAQTQAQILTEEPKVNKKKTSAWKLFKDNFVDKGTVFETMSLKTGNRELQAKWKAIGRAESSAQWFMENGNSSTSSLKSIRDTVEKSGKTKQFYEYLYHRHNVDRMNLENRSADMENKPVFGYDVTSEMSKK